LRNNHEDLCWEDINMMDKDLVIRLIDKHQRMKNDRTGHERDWQDIHDLVRTGSSNFNASNVPGRTGQSDFVLDSTAPEACEQLASGLVSYLTNPNDRWFTVGVVPSPGVTELDEESLAWLEIVSDMIMSMYSLTGSGFNTMIHEADLDVSAYGMSYIYQSWDPMIRGLSFRTYPVAACYVAENSQGQVDTVTRSCMMSVRQIEQEFGYTTNRGKDRPDRVYEVLHIVCPRTDRDVTRANPTNKRLASYYVIRDSKEILSISGYDALPYHVARWSKLADERYGRGPAHTCIADIRMLNSMEFTTLKAGQKATDPPLILPSEGFIMPIDTSPSSIIYKEPDAPEVQALEIARNLPWAEDKMEQKRGHIKTCFHSDWLRMEKDNKEMTALEVNDRRSEKLALLAPMLGRLQMEQLGPMIERSYMLMNERRMFPQAPSGLQRRKLLVQYVSPAARAQLASKANDMGRFTQEVIPLAQVAPDVLDVINWDKYSKKLAEYRGVSRMVLRTSQEIDQIRNERKDKEMVAQAAAVAEPATKAMKNVADARAKVPDIGSIL
jgi:hypothetical protein